MPIRVSFLAVWMDKEGLDELLENFWRFFYGRCLRCGRLWHLDVNVDSRSPSPVEILTAQALISEYETLALRIFGISRVNLDIMQRMRTLFLEAEIREKSMRGVAVHIVWTNGRTWSQGAILSHLLCSAWNGLEKPL
jgi:hypothetical protein